MTIIIIALIAIIAGILVLISLNMQKRNTANNVNLSADQIVSNVIKKMNYQNLSPVSKENISKFYDIPEDTVNDYAVYISNHSGNETEIACFKLKDAESEQKVLNCVYEYTKSKNPIEQSPATNIRSMVSSHYPYIFVAISSDCESAVKSFEKLIS